MLSVSIKKLKSKGINTLIRVLTVGLLLSSLTIVFLLASTLDKSFLKSTDKYDYILGSSTNSSQISLNSLYFISTPVSSIGSSYYDIVKDVKTLKSVVPLKQVDSYDGLQVIGTTREFFEGEVLKEGRLFSDNSKEIVVGSNVAKTKSLLIGSKVKLTHRTINNGGIVGDKVAGPDDGKAYLHEEEFTVVGILEGGNTVYDNLLYMDINDSHSLHSVDGKEEDKENTNVLDELDLTTINSILIKTGGSTGLNDLQAALHNDKAVSLYKLNESTDYIKDLRANISKVYPIFVCTMFILLSLMISLIYLCSIKLLKKDIVAMLSIRVPKSDVISYVILNSAIVTILSVLISYPIVSIATKCINSYISKWSLVINMGMSYLIPLCVLPVILIYVSMVSYVLVNGIKEEL